MNQKYRAYLNGDRYIRTDESRARWRRTLPWTDEQIADAILSLNVESDSAFVRHIRDKIAAQVRRGYLSAAAVSLALPVLIKTCAIAGCGKTALYRYGTEGRCKAHRSIQTAPCLDRIARIERRNVDRQRHRATFDTADLSHRNALHHGKFGRQR